MTIKDKDFFDNLTQRLCNVLPAHLQEIKKDVEKNFYAILQNTFNKLDLVTRKEFDAQAKVLARSRKKIEALEASVKELEKIVNKD
jgi:BMFP domain-containing protein YqiC